MAYTNVFGGGLIFPSQLSYVQITLAVVSELQWPTEQQITDGLVVADFIDVDATVAAMTLTMPSALATGTGNKTTFNNIGANAFDVLDNAGGAIQNVAPGEQWVVVLTDNTTAAGAWLTFQMGASVSNASAAALVGAGIKAISTTLNQKIDADIEAATPFTVVDADRARCLIYTAGAGVCNLPDPGVVGADWFFMLRNSGTGTLSVVAAAGDVNGAASISMDPEDSCFLFTDGANFYSIGLSAGSSIAFDFVSIPVAGSGDFTLSGANLNRISYRFTGLLTGNRTIIVPATAQQYWVDNQTTGAFTLAISTFGQVSPPTVTQGQTATLFCDGTSVLNANSSSSLTLPVTVGQGGTGATTVAGAQANLQVPPTSRQILAGDGMAGGGDLSADRTLDLDLSALATDTSVSIVNDFVVFADTSAGDDKKILVQNLFRQVGQVSAVKVVNTDRNSTTALTADPELTLANVPAGRYALAIFLDISCTSSTPGFKWTLTSSGVDWKAYGVSKDQTNAAVATLAGSFSVNHSYADVNPGYSVSIQGEVNNTGLGTVSIDWSQFVNNGTNVRLKSGSYLQLTPLGV